ncbi:MAG: hypothetical protein QXK71_04585 [Pyrobaculum sp.]|jgi:hypothetical protein
MEKELKRLVDIRDLLRSALDDKDWDLVEEALEELESLVAELEERL